MENNKFTLEEINASQANKIQTYCDTISKLRKDGENKLQELRFQLKLVSGDSSLTIGEALKKRAIIVKEVQKAKVVIADNKESLTQAQETMRQEVVKDYEPVIAKLKAAYAEREKTGAKKYREKCLVLKSRCQKDKKCDKATGKAALKKAYVEEFLALTSPTLTRLHKAQVERDNLLSFIQGRTVRNLIDKFYCRYKFNRGFYVKGDYEDVAQAYQDKLDALREDGENKITSTQASIKKLKKNKDMEVVEKEHELSRLNTSLYLAKQVQKTNADKVKDLIAQGCGYIKAVSPTAFILRHEDNRQGIKKSQKDYGEKIALAKENKDESMETARAIDDLKEHRIAVKAIKTEYQAARQEAKSTKSREIEGYKRDTFATFTKNNGYMINYRNGRPSTMQALQQRWQQRVYSFKFSNFLLSNLLYIVLILAFVICGFVSTNMVLFKPATILNILQFTATRIPFTLGVAGLILLGGTDLSVGRLVGMGSIFTMMFMSAGNSSGVPFFGFVLPTSTWDPFAQIAAGLVVTVLACTLFSIFSGFLTAKLRIHPFISTLATQLIVFGLMMAATGGTQNGTLNGISSDIVSKWGIKTSFPFALYIYAVIFIAIAWFIWNKTTFGKSLYAVGGNPAAAKASGISVVAVTVGAFALAGIFYGFGSFLEVGSFGGGFAAYGQGRELESIAAVVVGGISITGGKGKISGAVIGTLLFQMIFVALQILGVDSNLQFVVQGLIIVAAVALDSLKHLKAR